MPNNIMISIITTVKNGEAFIIETLQSVNNQTFQNFEHIIVDDGSTDKTVSIVQNYQKENPSYKIRLFQPGSLGRGKALIYAASKAKADWIAIIDADDLWHPQKLEIQYKYISENNIDVLATSSGLFSKKGELNFENIDKPGKIQYFNIHDMLKSNKISHSSVLIKKELCDYDENRKSQFDLELWLRFASKNKIICKINAPLNFHRIHYNQSFEGKNKFYYRLRSFRINAYYCIKHLRFDLILYRLIKLIITLIVPRKFIRKQL